MHSNPARNHPVFKMAAAGASSSSSAGAAAKPGGIAKPSSKSNFGSRPASSASSSSSSRPSASAKPGSRAQVMGVAAKAKGTKPTSSAAPKKFSAPAAKYGAPLPGREKSSALGMQRKKILAQAEKERLARQRKREAEAKAMKKREDDRSTARESEKKDRERRKRDLLLAEKKRREAASAAREDRRKEAAKQKGEYEAQVKARHKAFAERQQRAVSSASKKKSSQLPPSPKAGSAKDPVLSEFLHRKNAAESYRQRYNRNRLFGAPPAAEGEIAADSKDALGSTLTRRITYAESRSPAPKPPSKQNIRSESPVAPKVGGGGAAAAAQEDSRPAYVQPAAPESPDTKPTPPAAAAGGAVAAVRRRWGRSESPPTLQPVGTQVVNLDGSAGAAGTNVAVAAETKAKALGSPASRKRWGRSDSPLEFQPVGTQVIGLDGTSSVTDAPADEADSDDKKSSPERKRWGQPAGRKPFKFGAVGTGVLEFTGDLLETGVAEASNEGASISAGATPADGDRDDATPVPAAGEGDEVPPPADVMAQDQDDGDYEDMLCTMAELILNQDEDEEGTAATAAAPPSPSTPGKPASAATGSNAEMAAPATPDAQATTAAAGSPTEDTGAASGDDSGDDSYFEEESDSDTDDDDDNVMMGSDDEADDLLSSLRASPVTPAHGSRSKRGSMTSEAGDDEEEDMDEMLDMMRTALKNATPDKRDQLLRAAPSMSVDTLLKSGPVDGLRLKGENIRSLRVEAELEKTVFHKLEETRARLEDELGAMAFVQAYRMIQQWREADDDEEDSAARKAEIEHLLESKNAVESFQQLLHLVIKDSMHYENDADVSIFFSMILFPFFLFLLLFFSSCLSLFLFFLSLSLFFSDAPRWCVHICAHSHLPSRWCLSSFPRLFLLNVLDILALVLSSPFNLYSMFTKVSHNSSVRYTRIYSHVCMHLFCRCA